MNTKKMLLLATLFLLTLTASAQDFGFGAKGGGNINYFNGPDIDGKRTYGYNYGGFVSYNFTKNLGVQAEALYVRTALRSDSFSESAAWDSDKEKKKLEYLTFPLLVKIDVANFFSVVGGPQFNYLSKSGTYKLNDGSSVFASKFKTSYTAGVDLGPLYFRCIWGKSNFRHMDRTLHNLQYQIGFRVKLL